MSTITMGVDLAKSILVCEMDTTGRVLGRRDLGREAFAPWLAQQPPDTVTAMEACSGAHHWARRCMEYGLQPRLMAAQFATANLFIRGSMFYPAQSAGIYESSRPHSLLTYSTKFAGNYLLTRDFSLQVLIFTKY